MPHKIATDKVNKTVLKLIIIDISKNTPAIKTVIIISIVPIIPPIPEIKADSKRNSKIIFDLRAPIDFFIPISFVFSFTVTNIIVIIPIPETIKEIPPISFNTTVIILSKLFKVFRCLLRSSICKFEEYIFLLFITD